MANEKNTAVRNTLADAFAGMFNSGTVEIRDSLDTVLVTFNLGATAFGAATSGKVSASGVPIEATASAAGTADNAMLRSSDGITHVVGPLTVGTTATHVIIDNTSIENGQTVNLTKLDWTESADIA